MHTQLIQHQKEVATFTYTPLSLTSGFTANFGWTVNISSPVVVTLNANGGTGAPASLTYTGTAQSAPTAPTKEGFAFGGWYTDSNCTTGNEVNWANIPTADATYYAKWGSILTISFTGTWEDEGDPGTTSSMGLMSCSGSIQNSGVTICTFGTEINDSSIIVNNIPIGEELTFTINASHNSSYNYRNAHTTWRFAVNDVQKECVYEGNSEHSTSFTFTLTGSGTISFSAHYYNYVI